MKATMYLDGQPIAWGEFPDPPECDPVRAHEALEAAVGKVLLDAYEALPWWRRILVRWRVASLRPRPKAGR